MDPIHVRKVFADAGLERKAAQGEITQIVREVKTSHFARGDSRFGWSQEIVQWWNEGRLVAIVHQWRDASGELAASGRPDPKWVCTSGIAYRAADTGTKRVPEHDYRELDVASFAEVASVWNRDLSIPLYGWRCANCGWLWLELLSLENDAQFHTEAASLEDLVRID